METKVCNTCHTEKNISEFYFSNKKKGYRFSECRPCADVRTKRYYTLNEAEKKRRRESAKEWARANPEKIKVFSRKTRLKREYGLTLDQYQQMVSSQSGRCAICSTDKPGWRWPEWHIDHCHASGRIRGLLCHACNRNLGIVERMIAVMGVQKLLAYLAEP
jgi:hypothetical protein